MLFEIKGVVTIENVEHTIYFIIITTHGDKGMAAPHASRKGMSITCGHTVAHQVVGHTVRRRAACIIPEATGPIPEAVGAATFREQADAAAGDASVFQATHDG
jgi:hypothetical protein